MPSASADTTSRLSQPALLARINPQTTPIAAAVTSMRPAISMPVPGPTLSRI